MNRTKPIILCAAASSIGNKGMEENQYFLFPSSSSPLLKKSAVVGNFYWAVVVTAENTRLAVRLQLFSPLPSLPSTLNGVPGPISALHSLALIECLRGVLAAQ